MSTDGVKAYAAARNANQARRARVRSLQREWVDGSELTSEQLAGIQPALKAAFLEREQRRAS